MFYLDKQMENIAKICDNGGRIRIKQKNVHFVYESFIIEFNKVDKFLICDVPIKNEELIMFPIGVQLIITVPDEAEIIYQIEGRMENIIIIGNKPAIMVGDIKIVSSFSQKRGFPRIIKYLNVKITDFTKSQIGFGTTIDLSQQGLQLLTEMNLDAGQTYDFEVNLNLFTNINFTGEVVWAKLGNKNKYGILITEITPNNQLVLYKWLEKEGYTIKVDGEVKNDG